MEATLLKEIITALMNNTEGHNTIEHWMESHQEENLVILLIHQYRILSKILIKKDCIDILIKYLDSKISWAMKSLNLLDYLECVKEDKDYYANDNITTDDEFFIYLLDEKIKENFQQ